MERNHVLECDGSWAQDTGRGCPGKQWSLLHCKYTGLNLTEPWMPGVSTTMSLGLLFQRWDKKWPRSAVPLQQYFQASVHLQPYPSFPSNIGRLQMKYILQSFFSLGVTQIILGCLNSVWIFPSLYPWAELLVSFVSASVNICKAIADS